MASGARRARRKAQRVGSNRGWGPWEKGRTPQEAGYPENLWHFHTTWYNNCYAVMICTHDTAWGLIDRAQIKRQDGKPNLPWADMQRIKNELFGEDRCGLEVYPEKSKLIDEADAYHLWLLPKGKTLPFTLNSPHDGATVIEDVPQNLVGRELALPV